jgi:hypothetical protein
VLSSIDSYSIFAGKYFSWWERVVMRIVLPIAFAGRAAFCLVYSILKHDRNSHEKAQAFGIAAWRLLSGSAGRA